MDPIVRMRGIGKRFGTVTANSGVDLDLYAGEIHALLGENGAGKSTLMHVLAGSLEPDEGEIELAGERVRFANARQALRSGIGMVHQHFKLVPTLSIAANVLLNDEPSRRGVLDEAAEIERVLALARELMLDVDPRQPVGETSIATQQKVEILKALHRDVRVLILDEPTAVLTPQESRDLFGFLRRLADEGTAVILITHKLGEALELAARLSILRGGELVFAGEPAGQTPASLARLMVGRDVALELAPRTRPPGELVLEIDRLRASDDRGVERLRGVTLSCRAGEILGIAGVDGNGQTELVEVLAGLRPATGGSIRRGGESVAYIPEDRQGRALVLDLALEDNLVLRTFRRRPFARGLRLDRRQIRGQATRLLAEYDIRADAKAAARTLSGGNQQKLVVARELAERPALILASQPTRGVDVGAMQFVYRRLIAERDRGAAIVLISFDLDELLTLSDRIAVLFEGEVSLELPRGDAEHELLGLAMTGLRAA